MPQLIEQPDPQASPPLAKCSDRSQPSAPCRKPPSKRPALEHLKELDANAPRQPQPLPLPLEPELQLQLQQYLQQYLQQMLLVDAKARERYPLQDVGPTDGRMFLFNWANTRGQVARSGSSNDVRQLGDLADWLQFRLRHCEDLTREAFKKELFQALRQPFPDRVGGVFCLVLMGHGSQSGIMCADGEYVSLAEIRHWLSTAPALIGVPKFVIVVACRHNRWSAPRAQRSTTIQAIGVDNENELDEHSSSASPPVPYTQTPCRLAIRVLSDSSPSGVQIDLPEEGTDILWAMATIEGYASISTPSGSPYIAELCNVLREFAAREDALQMLTRVNNVGHQGFLWQQQQLVRMQPEFRCTLRSPLYLARATPLAHHTPQVDERATFS